MAHAVAEGVQEEGEDVEVKTGTDIGVHFGPIYTTDAFAAETVEFLEEWKGKNLLGIEMETSVVYTIATLYGIKAAALHIVSDNPITKKSFFDTLTEEEKRRRKECEELLMESLERLVARI